MDKLSFAARVGSICPLWKVVLVSPALFVLSTGSVQQERDTVRDMWQSRAGSGTGGALPTHHGEREQSSDSDQMRGKSHSDVAGGRSRGKASPWVGVRVQISTGMAVTKGAGPRSRATPEDEGRSSQPGVLQLCPFRAVTAAVPQAQAAALLGCNRLTESRACGHLHM